VPAGARLVMEAPGSGLGGIPAQVPKVRRLAAGGKEIRTFELVWGFWCQAIVFGFFRFFVRSWKPFFVPSPAIRFAVRAEGVKEPKR